MKNASILTNYLMSDRRASRTNDPIHSHSDDLLGEVQLEAHTRANTPSNIPSKISRNRIGSFEGLQDSNETNTKLRHAA